MHAPGVRLGSEYLLASAGSKRGQRVDLNVKWGRFLSLAEARLTEPPHPHRVNVTGSASTDEPLPRGPAFRGITTVPVGGEDSTANGGHNNDVVVDAVAGTGAGAGVLTTWLPGSDVDMLRAVSQLTHEHINGLVDLRRALYGHDYKLKSEHFVDMLRGHVGEQMVFDHLSEAGATLKVPTDSNMPGLDAWANGYPVNVKVTADALRAAQDHFALYPDIPMLVNADAGHVPANALILDPSVPFDSNLLSGDHLVVIDQALTLNDAANVVSDGIGAADGAAAATTVTFPYITAIIVAARSGTREAVLVGRGATTAGRATWNVAIDTSVRGGSVGAGAWSGLTMGAHVDAGTGGALMGLPTLILGIAGAVAGSQVGQRLASRWRERPLRQAQKSLQSALDEMEKSCAEATQSLNRYWTDEVTEIQLRLLKESSARQSEFDQIVEPLIQDLEDSAALDSAAVARVLDAAERALMDAPPPDPRRKWWPLSALDRRADWVCLTQAVSAWNTQRRECSAQTPGWDQTVAVFDLAMVTGAGRVSACDYLDTVERVRRQAHLTLLRASMDLERDVSLMQWQAEQDLVALSGRLDKMRSDFNVALGPAVARVGAGAG